VRWLILLIGLAALALGVTPPKEIIDIGYWGSGGYVGLDNSSDAFERIYFKWPLWNCGAESYWPVVPLCSSYGMTVVPYREYRFKRLTAIFNYTKPPTVSDWEILKWSFQKDLSFEEMDKKFGLGVFYGVRFIVTFGEGPLVNWSKLEYWYYSHLYGKYMYLWKEPGAVIEMQQVFVTFRWGVNNTRMCFSVSRLSQEDVWEWRNVTRSIYYLNNFTYKEWTELARVKVRSMGEWYKIADQCVYGAKPFVNVTAVARGNKYYLYIDGQLVYTGEGPGEAWIYAGPTVQKTSTYINVGYPTLWKTGEPIKTWLFIGNKTFKLPDYVYPYTGPGYLAARASPSPDGSVVVSPPYWRYGEQKVWLYNFTGTVRVRIGHETYELPNGTLLTPGRSCTASGRIYRVLGDAFVALGDGSVDCKEWRVVVEKPDGSEDAFYVPNGTAFEYTPLPLDLGNGTRLVNATPIRLFVSKPTRVEASYSGREYLLTFVGAAVECLMSNCTQYVVHNFTEAVWAPEGRLVAVEKYAVLHNGTRLVARATAVADGPKRVPLSISREYRVVVIAPNGTAEVWWPEGRALAISPYTLEYNNGTRIEVEGFNTTITRPVEVRLNYTVYYRVSVATPFNRTEGWVKKDTFINVTLPQFVDLGNKTALRSPNGTCAFIIDEPKRCTIVYKERLYWVSVRAPFNETEGWASEGSIVKLPEVFDLGNGTRWVGPGFYAVADRPINAIVAYRRQYYVEVAGVVEWRGWADEGSQIRLNETVVGGVKYVPQTAFIEVRRPISVRPNYTAYYYAQFKDVLGLPNPWTSMELCGKRFTADSLGVINATAETNSLCEIKAETAFFSPYSLAIIGAVATVAVAVVVRRLRKK